jgi:hypothetical protein
MRPAARQEPRVSVGHSHSGQRHEASGAGAFTMVQILA